MRDVKINKRVCLITTPAKEGIVIGVNNKKKEAKIFWSDKTTTTENFANIRYI